MFTRHDTLRLVVALAAPGGRVTFGATFRTAPTAARLLHDPAGCGRAADGARRTQSRDRRVRTCGIPSTAPGDDAEMGRLPRAAQNRSRSDSDQHGGVAASRILVAEVPQRDCLVHISANVIGRIGDVKTLIRDRRPEHERPGSTHTGLTTYRSG
jgi:hypothetical protein